MKKETAKTKYGKYLKEKRTSANLTQKDLAKALLISQSMLSKIEAGHLIPDLNLWTRICKYFSIPFEPLP